jgi:hypothetical protein
MRMQRTNPSEKSQHTRANERAVIPEICQRS